MNSQLHFSFLIGTVVTLLAVIIFLWYSMDMAWILKWMRHKNELSAAGRWRELEQHLDQGMKPRRPFVWLYRRYLVPGSLSLQVGLFLHNQKKLEEALAKIDEAIRQIDRKPAVFRCLYRSTTNVMLRSGFRTRTLVLTELGRYDEARAAAAELQRRFPKDARAIPALALLEHCCGNLDAALEVAQAVRPEDKEYDVMRGIVVKALCLKGELDEAQQALAYEAADASKFYTPAAYRDLSQNPIGAKLIESHQRKVAGVFKPVQWMLMAQVYIERKEFGNADAALGEAERTLGPLPGLQFSFCRHRALSLAGQGRAAEAENYLTRLREIARQVPVQNILYQKHFVAGRAYLYLGRFHDALVELTEAQRYVLHPLEKHVTIFYTAQAHEGVGNRREAALCYQAVASDPIPSWMRKSAVEALARRNG